MTYFRSRQGAIAYYKQAIANQKTKITEELRKLIRLRKQLRYIISNGSNKDGIYMVKENEPHKETIRISLRHTIEIVAIDESQENMAKAKEMIIKHFKH